VTRIKICGVTTVEDAVAAVELGADAIGLHLADTPRRVTPECAAQIAAAVPPFVTVVGVVTTEDLAILKWIRRYSLRAVQLHGNQSEEFARAISRYASVIRVARIRGQESLQSLGSWNNAAAYLLDTHIEGLLGGTGRTFDWEVAVKAKEFGRPIILAGGLGPDNVGEAIRKVRPYAVDASSRLETEVGNKDHEKMKEFIANVRAADAAS